MLRYLIAATLSGAVLYYINTQMSVSLVNYVIQSLVAVTIYVGIVFITKAPVIQLFRDFRKKV